MKVTIEDAGSLKKKLHIQVPPEVLAEEMQKAVADAAKTAKIPGFRPGKAPKNVVERHYAMEIQSDVMNRVISDSYMKALHDNNLNPVAMPNITNISPFEKGLPLNFTAVVEVRPDFTLGSYEGLEVKETPVAATDAEINETLERLREMYGRLEPVENEALAKEHTAVIDFEGFREGKSIEGAKAQDHVLPLGAGSLIPGFEEQLVGMKKGETRQIAVTFPADYHGKELAGKDAKFTVSLKEVKKKVLPELNDDFAKDIGEQTTLAELKQRLQEDIEIRKKNELASAQREELMNKLVAAHSFDVPESMVERELMSMARNQAMRYARQGMDLKTFDIAKFREQNRDLAVRRVKGMLILDAIAVKEKFDVSDEEMEHALVAMARRMNQKVEEIKQYYEKEEGGMEELRASLIHEKALVHLLSKAKKV
ncbi:MAG: trigger factor [Nitrospiraceae bacterium]|nr:trigger factor [Nitrospiraceae bacterium]